MSEIHSIGLRSESEFFRRNNNRILYKQKKIRTIKLRGIHIILALALFAAAGFAAYKAGVFIMTWEKFKVKSFKLYNSPGAHAKELQKIAARYSANIFSLDTGNLKKELLTLPAVKDVELSRKLPATIEIRFFLRKPVFQLTVEHPGGFKYDLIDDEGVFLGSRDKRSDDLIAVKDVRAIDRDKLLRRLAELNSIKDSIDYVGYKEPYGIMVKLKDSAEIFYPGESDFAGKIRYYRELKRTPLLAKYRIKSVDLRFADRIYFEYEQAGQETGTQDEEVNG